MKDFPIYATIKQLATRYHIHYNTTRQLVSEMHKSGHSGVIYIGRLPRVDIDKFQEFLSKRREEKEAEWHQESF